MIPLLGYSGRKYQLDYITNNQQTLSCDYTKMKKANYPLRQFIETIEQHCNTLDRDELLQLVCNLAKQVKPKERASYLDLFQTCVKQTGETANPTEDEGEEEVILAEIAELRLEIKKRIDAIDDGSYWEDPDEDEWEGSYHYDDEPELLSDYQQRKLIDFFSEAAFLFAGGKKKGAKNMYESLFNLLDDIEQHGYLPFFEVDLPEERARYARSLYEVSPPKERVNHLLRAMKVTQDLVSYFDDGSIKLPLLQNVLDADTSQLEGWDQFLTVWRTALEKYDYTFERIAILRLEGAYLHDGLEAVIELARSWKAEQPQGYLYWLELLEKNGAWQKLLNVCNEAMEVIPPDCGRWQVAEFMIMAGKNLNDNGVILQGHREFFRSVPDNSTLLELVGEAGRQQLRQQELEGAVTFLREQSEEMEDRPLLVKALLMAGKFQQGFELCQNDKGIGWSREATGLVFSSVLYLLCRGDASCSGVYRLLDNYSTSLSSHYLADTVFRDKDSSTMLKEILHGLELVDTTSLDMGYYQKWVMDIGEKRVNHIVSNTYRKAYPRAAMVLTSLAEILAYTGATEQAQTLLHGYCKVRYSRHRAFRQEVREAVATSEIIGDLAELL